MRESKVLERREDQFLRMIPYALSYDSLLYIGASPHRQQLLRLFVNNFYHVTILEAWDKNIEGLKELNQVTKIYDDLVHGDVRRIDEMAIGFFDVVLWWHGPEHIDKREFEPTVKKLEVKAYEMVIMGCPFGEYPQAAVKGNEHERHLSALYPEDFAYMGYRVATIGERNIRGGNILAWKKI